MTSSVSRRIVLVAVFAIGSTSGAWGADELDAGSPPDPAAEQPSSRAPSSPAIEEIVVTASKAGASDVMRTAVTADVIGAEEVAGRSIRDVQDLQLQVPGLVADMGSTTPKVAIRGVGHDNFLVNAESGVVPYIDGVALARTQGLLAGYFDLERVEVLKGPQGSSFGRNAIGGTINYVARKPEDGFVGELGAEVGNLGRRQYSAILNYGQDLFGIRLGAMTNEDDGYVENRVDGEDQNAVDQKHFRAVARFGPWSHLLATFLFHRMDEDTNRFGQGLTAAIPTSKPRDRDPSARMVFTSEEEYATYSDVTDPFLDTEMDLAVFNLEWEAGDLWLLRNISLRSITGYSTLRWRSMLDHDQTDVKYLISRDDFPSDTLSQEFVVQADVGPLQALIGYYYLDDDAEQQLDIDFAAGVEPVGGHALFNDTLDTVSHGYFTDLVYPVTGWLRLLAGYRHTSDARDAQIDQQFQPFPTELRVALCDVSLEKTFYANTGHLGLEADIWNDIFGYVKASRGFKAGGFNIAGCNNPYDPEILNAYETGLKGRFLDGNLWVTFSGFLYDYNDLQVTVIRPVTGVGLAPSSSTVENASGAEILGMDFSLRYLLPHGLSFDANLAWLPTAEYGEFVSTDPLAPEYFDSIPVTNPPDVDLAGRRLNRAPELSSTIGVNYARELFAGWDFDGRLEYYTVSQQFYSPYRRPKDENAQDGYYNLNAYVTLHRGDSWTVRAYGKNLTDEFVLSGITENTATGHLFVDYGRPREFGAGVTYRFAAPW